MAQQPTHQLAQTGVITDPNSFVEYLTFELISKNELNKEELTDAVAKLTEVEQSLTQQYPQNDLTISIGVSAHAWQYVFPTVAKPLELKKFVEFKDADRSFPSTAGDVFCMIKSERMDVNFLAAKQITRLFAGTATLIEDIQGFKYREDRDLIDFVDGTENPTLQARFDAVLVDDDAEQQIHHGGSYLTVQRYVTRQQAWEAQPTKAQEAVIGRTKADNIEFSDEEKAPTAHNVKSKLKVDGKTVEIFRQNRPYGNAMEYGTMFVGFAKSAMTLENSLKQMIMADEDGNYDHLLNFVEAKTGNQFFMPSKALLASLGEL